MNQHVTISNVLPVLADGHVASLLAMTHGLNDMKQFEAIWRMAMTSIMIDEQILKD